MTPPYMRVPRNYVNEIDNKLNVPPMVSKDGQCHLFQPSANGVAAFVLSIIAYLKKNCKPF